MAKKKSSPRAQLAQVGSGQLPEGLNKAMGAIDSFRATLWTARNEVTRQMTTSAAHLGLRTPFRRNVHPLHNIHATGVGIRRQGGQWIRDEFVIKVYVFHKGDNIPTEHLGLLAGSFQGVGIDVEELPILSALAPPNQKRVRPVVGGLEIQPRGADFVGTLGCFVKGSSNRDDTIYALSNNHVMADTNRLPVGTEIVQPHSNADRDVFAMLSDFVPIILPTPQDPVPGHNRIDAAIAAVTDTSLVSTGKILGIGNYNPVLKSPVPGMEVTKSGRTTGVTTGIVSAIGVNNVQINYGEEQSPIVAVFDGTVQIAGDGSAPFSMPGDSGSAIVEQSSGHPVALLFAGDDNSTTACDLTAVCARFNVVPA